MTAKELTRRVVRVGLGPAALARPRQAALTAALLLAFGALIWVLIRSSASVSPSAVDRFPPREISAAQITQQLSRSGYGPGGSDIRVLWATPEYFRFARQSALAAHYDVERNLVFFLWENIHDGDLPGRLLPALRVDGATAYLPARVIVPAEAAHHRFSVFLYPQSDGAGKRIIGARTRLVEMILPPVNADGAQSVLAWALPLLNSHAPAQASLPLAWSSLLPLMGGVLAAMWPCLFQLTAYFIPSLAGVSVSHPHLQDPPGTARFQVVKAAAFFVLGFVIVYTAAGAAAGFAAQSLNGTSLFWNLQRPLSIAAGLVIIFMALRLAANARAALVCKMPLGVGRGPTGYLGTMLLGLAFATGCTTCFGAALILGIITYVGIAGTPLLGALMMFLFSVGMAIPLILGAAAMARVLRLLTTLERAAPALVLASSAIMVGFAALLLSGRFMLLSNWLFRSVAF